MTKRGRPLGKKNESHTDRTSRLTVTMPPETKKAFSLFCTSWDISMSDRINELVRRDMDANDLQQSPGAQPGESETGK